MRPVMLSIARTIRCKRRAVVTGKTGANARMTGKISGIGFRLQSCFGWHLQLRSESPILIHDFSMRFGEGIVGRKPAMRPISRRSLKAFSLLILALLGLSLSTVALPWNGFTLAEWWRESHSG